MIKLLILGIVFIVVLFLLCTLLVRTLYLCKLREQKYPRDFIPADENKLGVDVYFHCPDREEK